MKRTQVPKADDADSDDMLREYDVDYSKSRPNRFAGQIGAHQCVIVLDPDISEVFKTSAAVNAVLRALIATMPPTTHARQETP